MRTFYHYEFIGQQIERLSNHHYLGPWLDHQTKIPFDLYVRFDRDNIPFIYFVNNPDIVILEADKTGMVLHHCTYPDRLFKVFMDRLTALNLISHPYEGAVNSFRNAINATNDIEMYMQHISSSADKLQEHYEQIAPSDD